MTTDAEPMQTLEEFPVSGGSSDDEGEFFGDVVGVERNLTDDGGVKKKVLVRGEGHDTPETGDEVTVHYVGTLLDGSEFDSSRARSDPFKFKLGVGQVIKGWDEGVASMKKGEKALLTCTSDYAYGASGSPPKIPPGATLQFEVELLSWKSEKDMLGDGGIIKTAVAGGAGWSHPKDADKVTVKYTACVRGEAEPFASTGDEGVEFTLKEGHLCPAIAISVKDMKKGEKVHLLVAPKYGRDTEQWSYPSVPAGAAIEIELELASWKAVTELADGVTMTMLAENSDEYKRPNEGARVTVRYVGRLQDGTVFVEHPEGSEHVWTTDEEAVVEGLELAVMKMKKGERAAISIRNPAYGFGASGAAQPMAAVPGDAPLEYEVELVEFENAKQSWEMSEEEKVAEAGAIKASGNAFFKAGGNERALRKYTRALGFVEHEATFKDAAVVGEARAMKKSCLLNKAAALLRLNRHSEVVATCGKILEMERFNVKALFRRAQAYCATEDFDDAIADLKRAAEVEPENREVAAQLKRARALLAQANKKQAKLYGNMFERMAKMEEKDAPVAPGSTPADGTVSAAEASAPDDAEEPAATDKLYVEEI